MSAEDLLTHTLQDVVETTDYPTTSMATVAARSRTLGHGRRRTAALLAAAAALVVVAGGSAAVWLGHDHATTQSPTGHLDPAGSLPDVPQGEAPQVAFLEGDAFVTASGERITSPAFRKAATATAFGEGVLVAGGTTPGRVFPTISLVAGGSTQRLGCGSPAFALGGADPAYWLSDDCRIVSLGRLFRGTTSSPTTKGQVYSPVRITSAGLVANSNQVIPNAAGSTGPVLIDAQGGRHRIPHVFGVAAASPSGALVTGLSSRGGFMVIETSTGAVQWRAPGWSLGHFSASGRYVVGEQKVGRQTTPGVGDVVGIWDANTGRQVLRVVLPNLSIVGTAAWEGDRSVLVVVEDRQQQQAIVRVALDGTVTRATRVAPSGEGTFRLAATP